MYSHEIDPSNNANTSNTQAFITYVFTNIVLDNFKTSSEAFSKYLARTLTLTLTLNEQIPPRARTCGTSGSPSSASRPKGEGRTTTPMTARVSLRTSTPSSTARPRTVQTYSPPWALC